MKQVQKTTEELPLTQSPALELKDKSQNTTSGTSVIKQEAKEIVAPLHNLHLQTPKLKLIPWK